LPSLPRTCANSGSEREKRTQIGSPRVRVVSSAASPLGDTRLPIDCNARPVMAVDRGRDAGIGKVELGLAPRARATWPSARACCSADAAWSASFWLMARLSARPFRRSCSCAASSSRAATSAAVRAPAPDRSRMARARSRTACAGLDRVAFLELLLLEDPATRARICTSREPRCGHRLEVIGTSRIATSMTVTPTAAGAALASFASLPCLASPWLQARARETEKQ